MVENQSPPTDTVLQMLQGGQTQDQIITKLKQQGYGLQHINEAINQANIKNGVEGGMSPSGSPQGGTMANEQQYQPSEEMQVSELEKEEIPVPAPAPAAAPQQEAMAAQPFPQDYAMPSPQDMAASAMAQQQFSPMPQGGYNTSYEDMQSLVEEIIDEKWREMLSSLGDITTWKVQMMDETEAIKQEILRVQTRFDNLQTAVLGKVDEYSKGVTNISGDMQALEKVFEKILEPLSSNIKELAQLTEKLREKHHQK